MIKCTKKEVKNLIQLIFSLDSWNEYMGEVFKLLHQHGVGQKEILDLMASLDFTPGQNRLFKRWVVASLDFTPGQNRLFKLWVVASLDITPCW